VIPSLVLLLATSSSAQDKPCDGTYQNETLIADLDAVDEALRTFDTDGARELLSGAHRRLLCLDERADPEGIARLSRQLALTFFFDQDEDAMRRWSMLSRELAPDLPWYADMAEDYPFRALFSGFEIAAPAGPDASLIPPKNGGIFWNGRYVDTVEAPMEMPALIQVADKKGQWIQAWWQDGSAWPESVLGPPGPPLKSPKWLTEATPDPRHGEHAGRPLFSEPEEAVAAVEEAPAEPAETEEPALAEPSTEPADSTDAVAAPRAPAPQAKEAPTYSEAEIAAARDEAEAGAYRDPFEDARRRAIRREFFSSVATNDAGDTVTINTEVVTFKRDRSGGEPVTYEIFDYWKRDAGAWEPAEAVAAGQADTDYLQDWIDGRPPPNSSQRPVVWVSFAAATAYCDTFGLALPDAAELPVGTELKWEWRLDGDQPARVNAKGKRVGTESSASREDTGFRCK